jgi:branched-chain amino acid transport system permease protein
VTTVLRYTIDAISLGAIDALIALGLGLVFGLMRLVNFAHGDLVTTGAYMLFVLAGVSVGVAVPVMIITVIAVALVLERIAFRPLRNADPMTLLVTSFAVSYLLQNLDTILFNSRTKSVALPTFFSNQFRVGSLDVPNLDLVTIGVTSALLIGLRLFFARTATGVQMLAAASDFSMARLLGVRANRVIALAFGMSGLLAGVVSFTLIAQLGDVTPTLGVQPVLIGFAGVIIGGMGSLVGAALGGFVLGALTIALQASLPLSARPFRDAFVFGIVILFLLLRPPGLVASAYVAERA